MAGHSPAKLYVLPRLLRSSSPLLLIKGVRAATAEMGLCAHGLLLLLLHEVDEVC